MTSSPYLARWWRETSAQIAIGCWTQRGMVRGRVRARCEPAGGVEVRRGGRKENGPGSPGRPERCRSPTPLNSPLPRCRWASHQWSRTNPETQRGDTSAAFIWISVFFMTLNISWIYRILFWIERISKNIVLSFFCQFRWSCVFFSSSGISDESFNEASQLQLRTRCQHTSKRIAACS